MCRDAVVLSAACKPLHAAVAASKWQPPYSPLPHIAQDGTVSEPLSGRFSVICRPEEGGEGIQRAIANCEEGGAILLLEGVYHVTRKLLISRSVHIFGRGRVELRGSVSRFQDMIESTSPSATLDRLRIDNQTEAHSCTLVIASGHLRLQGCDVLTRAGNPHAALFASGPSTLADVLGCTFRGVGGSCVGFVRGASGRVEGCDIRGSGKGIGIFLYGAGTSPLVSRNTVRDFRVGMQILHDVDPSWTLDEGNVFTNCAEGVEDQRGQEEEEEEVPVVEEEEGLA